MISVQFSDEEAAAAGAALYTYRSETQHYLRGYGHAISGHSDCCKVAKVQARIRDEQRTALNKRLREIDGAIRSLESAT